MLSVILPSYNEEKMISVATGRLAAILGGAGIDYELLFVDDGSKDKTWDEIQACAALAAHVVGVVHEDFLRAPAVDHLDPGFERFFDLCP